MADKMIEFKPMPEWVLQGFKECLTEEVDLGLVKYTEDAFWFMKGWFTQKGNIPIEAAEFIEALQSDGKLHGTKR